ncbi:MAG TPA: 3-hydroxyacyl-CoA dehydrogenase/enoyl-CoA hydratase family protein [Polyangiaceae bacterium]|nr:3-hydroxyacyl-CoA dehydrogenase/enoyl-CoA hydratase family protein [Polyangiaceae bacterium]
MIVGVIGSGAIGPDLAYGFLSALSKDREARVFLVDVRQEALDAGVSRVRGYIEKAVSRGKIAGSVAKAIERALTPTLDLKDLAACAYVLEAASEDLATKRRILTSVEAVVRPDCLIGFATSGLPRAQIAVEASRPERCFVNHPFYPAWRSLPIEVVLSGDAALGARMLETLRRLGKVPIVTADVECFAADDVFCNYISEAARLVERGIATVAQVDAIVNDAIGGGGPFNVMDLTRGNLLVHKCQLLMQSAKTGTPWFAPPPILEKQGRTPWHDPKAPQIASYDASLRDKVLDRILAVLCSRTYFVIEHDVCTPTETNWLTRTALGFRKGTLELAEELGGARAAELCERYAAHNPGFFVPRAAREASLPRFKRNVLIERGGAFGVIKVFRPEVKNALSKATLLEIDSALTELEHDASVRGIVLTSYDGAFAGADIQELAVLADAEACREMCRASRPLFEHIARASKPVVSATDGPVLGGGAELAMACHARVVGKSLVLGQPEVNLGIIPGYGATQRLPRLLGVERALELMRSARTLGAAEAVAWGWASVGPVEDVLAAAKKLIGEHLERKVTLAPIAEAPIPLPASIPSVDIGHRSLAIDAIVVDVVRRGLALPLAQGLEIEADGFARCKGTVDMDIGMKNFIQNGPRVPAAFLHE